MTSRTERGGRVCSPSNRDDATRSRVPSGLSAAPHAGTLCVLLVCMLVAPRAVASGTEERPTRHVVLMASFGKQPPVFQQVEDAVREGLRSESVSPVELYVEELDAHRFRDRDTTQGIVDLIRRKYANKKIALVITAGLPALDFAIKHGETVFPGAPTVFTMVGRVHVVGRSLRPNMCGVTIPFSIKRTLDAALALQPDADRVAVIAGQDGISQGWLAQAKRELTDYHDRVQPVWLTDMTLDEVCRRVAELPDRSLVLHVGLQRDSAGNVYMIADALVQIAAASRVPVYGFIDNSIGRGAVGGHMWRGRDLADATADLCLDILLGRKTPSSALVHVLPKTYIFDARQLERWGMDESRLPGGSIVLHREPGFLERYWRYALVGALLIIVETLLIVGLSVNWLRLRRATAALTNAEQRYRTLVESSPSAIMAIRDGRFIFANPAAARLLGYAEPEELVGRPAPDVVAPESRQAVLERMARLDEGKNNPQSELQLLRQDGSVVSTESTSVAIRLTDGPAALIIAQDITERKRASLALRESEAHLRELARRLISAQEDERRRLARELHDDVTQQLASLAMDAAMLEPTVETATAPAEAAGQLGSIAARLRKLASSVGHLSRQLHPSILDNLGLGKAVESECAGFSKRTGIAVDYAADAPVEGLRGDAALALYRSAQEGLRNVEKHSHALSARVWLRRSGGDILLTISDTGTGFDVRAAREEAGLGLASMEERVVLFGGALSVESAPGKGTTIEVRLPFGEDET